LTKAEATDVGPAEEAESEELVTELSSVDVEVGADESVEVEES